MAGTERITGEEPRSSGGSPSAAGRIESKTSSGRTPDPVSPISTWSGVARCGTLTCAVSKFSSWPGLKPPVLGGGGSMQMRRWLWARHFASAGAAGTSGPAKSTIPGRPAK